MSMSFSHPVDAEQIGLSPSPNGGRSEPIAKRNILAAMVAVAMVAALLSAATAQATVATKSAPTDAAAKYQAASSRLAATSAHSRAAAVVTHSHSFTVATKSAPTTVAAAYRQAIAAKTSVVIRGERLVLAHRGAVGESLSPGTLGGMTLVAGLVAVVTLGLAAASSRPRTDRPTRFRLGRPDPAR